MGTKGKIKTYIELWEKRGYKTGIPDEAPTELEKRLIVPSYKSLCIALMKNDYTLKTLGYSRPKCKLYSEIKRHEIYNRPCKYKQLDMFM